MELFDERGFVQLLVVTSHYSWQLHCMALTGSMRMLNSAYSESFVQSFDCMWDHLISQLVIHQLQFFRLHPLDMYTCHMTYKL